jgi:hypothetical protein
MDIIFDTLTHDIDFVDDSRGSHGDNINIKLNRHGETINLKGMKIVITVDSNAGPQEYVWPGNGPRYVSTNQDFLIAYPIKYIPMEIVTIKIIVTYQGEQYGKEITFESLEDPVKLILEELEGK